MSERTLLFLGDSITDSHRLWLPENDGLGNGYVFLLRQALEEQTASGAFRLINRGHDGFTCARLLAQLEELLRIPAPASFDVIVLLIGINDVGVCKNTGTDLTALHFADTYRQVLIRLRRHTSQILCLAPFIFPQPQEFAGWIPEVSSAEQMIREAAAACGCHFLPLHDRLNKIAGREGYAAITTDGIHLTARGHRLIADALLEYSHSFSFR